MNEKACRELVRLRAENCCERCCRATGLTVHHRLKRSQGGLWTPDNCVLLCGHGTAGCHGWIEHHADAAALTGWHVRPWCDPGEIAVYWRMSQWVLLRADGELHEI